MNDPAVVATLVHSCPATGKLDIRTCKTPSLAEGTDQNRAEGPECTGYLSLNSRRRTETSQKMDPFSHKVAKLSLSERLAGRSHALNTLLRRPPRASRPTELLFLLQQDEAERRVPQEELPGRGQAHDAASHHRHIVGAETQVKGQVTRC